jgi:hypothetical protein
MNDVDIHVTNRCLRDVEEVNVILSECHYGLVSSLEWRLFNVHPRERGAIGSFQEAHVQAE